MHQITTPTKESPLNRDFERAGVNVLSTSKNLLVKDVLSVNDTEAVFRRGQKISRTEVRTSGYTTTTKDYLVGVSQLGGDLASGPTIGLPRPTVVGVGKTFIVKDEAGGAGTTTITVVSGGEENIDGASSSTLTTNYQAKKFYTDGANWFTI